MARGRLTGLLADQNPTVHRLLVSVVSTLAALVVALTSVLVSAPPSDAGAAAPVVTHLSRHSGPTTGGQRLTLTGRGFTHVRTVRFGRTRARFTVVSARRLKVRVPAHRAARVDVVVTTARGSSRKVVADRYRYVAGGVRRTWRSALLPLPADADATGQNATGAQVSCASSTLCAAIGGYRAGATDRALLSVYTGTGWSSSDPEPAGASGIGINGISCAATTCVAAGVVLTGGHWEGFVDRWSGGSWHFSVLPHPAAEPSLVDQWTEVTSVSCWTGGCVAVGYYEAVKASPDAVAPAVWRWNGSTWSADTLPLPADADTLSAGQYANVDHVGCSAATLCVAGGDYVAGGEVVGLVERYDGTTWHAAAAPVPTGGSQLHVNAASCSTGGTCVVVGQYYDTYVHEQGLIEVWHGGTWTNVTAYTPPDAAPNPWVVLEGASCHGTDACLVAGSYVDTTGHHHSLVESLAGSTGTMVLPTRPADASALFEELHDVACATSCVAVGDYDDTGDVTKSYLSLGPAWSPLTPLVPNQPSSVITRDNAVSCAPDGFCMAVGDLQVSGGDELVTATHN